MRTRFDELFSEQQDAGFDAAWYAGALEMGTNLPKQTRSAYELAMKAAIQRRNDATRHLREYVQTHMIGATGA